MIDSHAHVTSEFYENIDDIVNEIKEKNIKYVINCGSSISSSKEIIELSYKYNSFLLPCIGVHPESVSEIVKIDEIEKLIQENKIYAVGEIGLDYYWIKDNKELQKELFNMQLDLAEKYHLPVIVHTRDSIQDCFDLLKKRKLRGVIHCFNGSYEMAKEFIKIGYKLGIGGTLTFKNSRLYEIIEKISVDDILLETDSPFLTPEPLRGMKNIPSNVYYIAEKISEIKCIKIDEVIDITTKNAISLFDI